MTFVGMINVLIHPQRVRFVNNVSYGKAAAMTYFKAR